MKNSKAHMAKAERAHDLAEWFRTQATPGASPEADLMARAAAALERLASQGHSSLANDNQPVTNRRVQR